MRIAMLLLLVAGTRSVDVVTFSPPAGWNVEEKTGSAGTFVVMNRIFGSSWCQAALYRGTPASGDLAASFAAEWTAVALQSIDPVAAPAPVTRKVGNTTAAVGSASSTTGGQPAFAKLIVLDGGASVASLLVMSSSKQAMKTCDADMEPMLAGLVVQRTAPLAAAQPAAPASAPSSLPLPTKVSALAGEWALTDGINITYVDRYTGSYTGTDSLHFQEKWIITEAGGISLDFFGIKNGKKIAEKNSGTIAIENGIVIIRMSNMQRYVLRGWYDGPNATVLVMNGPWYEAPIPKDILANPEQGSNLDKKWLRKK